MNSQLYLISPSKFDLSEFIVQVESALSAGGIKFFQLRMKEASDGEVEDAALKIQTICKKHNTPFIINDRIEVAIRIGADGIHLGQDDIADDENFISNLRQKMGKDFIIGISCYDNRNAAISAADQDANYVSFGAFYPTKTKEPKGFPTTDIIKWWKGNYDTSVCAIGGIKPHNCRPIVKAGADYIAVVTGVWDDQEGVKTAIKKYQSAIQSA